MNRKARQAWELYLKVRRGRRGEPPAEAWGPFPAPSSSPPPAALLSSPLAPTLRYAPLQTNSSASPESARLLALVANDCYKVGAFLVAAKAFDTLQRLDDSDPEFWEGKRGACVGVLQQVIAGMEGKDALREVLVMLRNTSNPQVEYVTRTINKWAQANGGL